MRTPLVAVLIVAIGGVVGFGVWANQEDEPRFCTLGAPITPPHFELEGYEVMLQDSGDRPGPDDCDGPDRPGRGPEESDDTGGYQLPPASSTSLPPGSVPDEDPPDPRVVLGHDCRYRDADGEVVATAEPNRPDDTCGVG